MKKPLLSLTLLLLFFGSYCQQATFQKEYPIVNDGYADLVFSYDDGYILAGMAIKEYYGLYLIKTDLQGDTVWTKMYDINVPGISIIRGTSDPEGNMYICPKQSPNGKLVKIDPQGTLIWSKIFELPQVNVAFHDSTLWLTTMGNYLYKIDPYTGDSLWRSDRFGSEFVSPQVINMVNTADGDLYMPGSLDTSSQMFMLPANFDSVVQLTINTPLPHLTVTDCISSQNEILVVARLYVFGENTNISYFVRFNDNWEIQASKEIVLPGDFGSLSRLIVNNNNEVVSLGYIHEEGEYKVYLHCNTMDGDSVWSQRINTPIVVDATDIKLAPDGGYIISAFTDEEYSHPYAIKTDSYGIITGIDTEPYLYYSIAYPNPAIEKVVFNTENFRNGNIQIANAYGKICSVIPVTAGKTEWDCSVFPSGIYIYTIRCDSGSFSGKVIVK